MAVPAATVRQAVQLDGSRVVGAVAMEAEAMVAVTLLVVMAAGRTAGLVAGGVVAMEAGVVEAVEAVTGVEDLGAVMAGGEQFCRR